MMLTDYFIGNLGIRAKEFVQPVPDGIKTLVEV